LVPARVGVETGIACVKVGSLRYFLCLFVPVPYFCVLLSSLCCLDCP